MEPWKPGDVLDLWGEDEGSFEYPPRPKSAADLRAMAELERTRRYEQLYNEDRLLH